MNSNAAPGAPGIRPSWSSSAKDIVTTGLEVSRVWATLGFGILNEVYWPATGKPQIRDLGFIVAGPNGWSEVKRVNNYRVSLPEPYIPLPHIVHQGDDYELALEVLPDPLRDVVLISFRLTGDGLKLYALLAPHLGNSGEGNNARAGADLTAWKDDNALCLVADCGFSRSSAGFVGVSDGWQDFAANKRMAWTYAEALGGNVALLGELQGNEGTLALGLADTIAGARTKARSSLSVGYAAVRERFIDGWRAWGTRLEIPDAPADIQREAWLSAAVLKVHQDRTYPGSTVASLSVPWGSSTDTIGGYHLVWGRDCVETGLALAAVGQTREARRMLAYLIAIQNEDGSWNQNCFPDGRPFWLGIQLDEVGLPIVLAAKLAELDMLRGVGAVSTMVERAARFLVNHGPVSPQDRWEENSGISPFTLAVEIVSLIAAAEFLTGDERDFVLSLAGYWNERIEDWTYSTGGPLAEQHGVEGYYVRIGPAAMQGGMRGRVNVANRFGESIPAAELIGMEYLALVRFGLRAADDPRIENTCAVTDAVLKVETPSGTAYHRYNDDGYGEHADGSPFDGNGVGRAWPLLTGERGHYEVQRGNDPLPWLRMMTRMTGPVGMLPEQVWDTAPIPARGLEPGKPTGSAMPLVWAHAEFLKLLRARADKRPLELLKCVETHLRRKDPHAGTWHWRVDALFDALPADRELLVELDAPFVLHMGFDGWQAVADRSSAPLPFGRHGVRLARNEFAGRATLDFTLYRTEAAAWDGSDYHVRLAHEGAPQPARATEPAIG